MKMFWFNLNIIVSQQSHIQRIGILKENEKCDLKAVACPILTEENGCFHVRRITAILVKVHWFQLTRQIKISTAK